MGVKYGQGLRINGMGPEKDFSASLTVQLDQVPERSKFVQFTEASNVLVTTLPTTVEVEDLTITGNIKGLKIESSDPTKVVFDGYRALKVGDFHNVLNPVYALVTTEYGTRSYRINITTDLPLTIQKKAGTFKTGSLGKACTDTLRAQIGPHNAGSESQDVFSPGGAYPSDGSAPTVTPNPTRMLPDLDLSGVSVTRQAGDGISRYPVMLVSPRHFVCNYHCGVYPPLWVYYRRTDGVIHKATVVDVIDLGADLRVGIFDADVPNCAVYATLPMDWEDYMPSTTLNAFNKHRGTPAIMAVVRQANPGEQPGTQAGNNIIQTPSPKLRVTWISTIDETKENCTVKRVQDEPEDQFFNGAYPGDSGSPIFVLVPNLNGGFTPALVMSYFGANSGPAYPVLSDRINDAIAELSARNSETRIFQMGTVDISRFTKYPRFT